MRKPHSTNQIVPGKIDDACPILQAKSFQEESERMAELRLSLCDSNPVGMNEDGSVSEQVTGGQEYTTVHTKPSGRKFPDALLMSANIWDI